MRINKAKAKEYATVALSLFPLYGIAKWVIASKRVRDAYQNNNIEIERIQAIIDSMPETKEEFDEFVKNGDPEAIRLYNEALNDAKLSGEVSPEFLQENGFETKEELFDKLDTLLAQGKAGDLQAREEFNSLLQGYENDFFGQASNTAGQNYFAEFGDIGVVEFDPTLLDCVMNVDPKTLIVGIASVGGLACIAGYIYKLKKKAAKIVERKKPKKERKRLFKDSSKEKNKRFFQKDDEFETRKGNAGSANYRKSSTQKEDESKNKNDEKELI